MKQMLRFLSALIILTMACAVPGLSTDSPQPLPTPDTRLESMVALTVSAALEMTQQAVPTETPLPTATIEPTATHTPQPDSSGSSLIKSEDGTFTFIDSLGKYQFSISSELIPLRINQQEYLDAWLLPEASNPVVQRYLDSLQKQDPSRVRLYIFDFDEERMASGFINNINVLWEENEDFSLEDETDIVELANSYPEMLSGSEVLTTEITNLENGMRIGVITSNASVTTLENVDVILFQKQIVIDLSVGTLALTLSTDEKWQNTIEPLFDEILETIILID